jgi:hypothetical protein
MVYAVNLSPDSLAIIIIMGIKKILWELGVIRAYSFPYFFSETNAHECNLILTNKQIQYDIKECVY